MSLKDLITGTRIEQPLKQWVESCDEAIRDTLQTLLQTYRMTNDCYDDRFSAEKRIPVLSQYLEELENHPVNEVPAKKLKGIVKANILLRRGQVKANAFQDPTGDFQSACSILEQIYDPNSDNDLLKFLAQLNLGKYFRNMGMYNHRSDYYWRAFDEFKALLDNLVRDQTEGGSEPWQDYIWLEAAMNLSRTELYLYHLRDAKIHLWQIYEKTAAENSLLKDNQIKETFYPDDCPVQTSNYIQISETKEILSGTKTSDETIKSNQEILINYSTQALIQLGIAFRKTRDYQIARNIFAFVLNPDLSVKKAEPIRYNVDALNNYAVCLRKSGMKLESIDEREEGFLKEIGMDTNDWKEEKKVKRLYFSLLTCLCRGQNSNVDIKCALEADPAGQADFTPWNSSSKNRFATIEYIRASLLEGDNRQVLVKEIGKFLDELLERNPNDREILLQKGILLQQKGKLEESQIIFQKLYRESPQIAKGTIGLKAYYNMGCNLLAQKRFYEAQTYFQKIKGDLLLLQTNAATASNTDCMDYLNDLPGTDLLADIDEGWCLINVGKYSEAKALYDAILARYKPIPARLGRHNQMKIWNNRLECCLQLLAAQKPTPVDTDDTSADDLVKKIREYLDYIEQHEHDNAVTACHHGYFYLLLGKRNPDVAVEMWQQSMQYFEAAGLYRFDDVYTYSGWVSAAYAWFSKVKKAIEEKEPGDTAKVLERVQKRLRYAPGVYSMKSCAKLSEMLADIVAHEGFPKEEEDALYRSFARIQLSKEEEGYRLFQDLRESDDFCGLDSVYRGRLLAVLFRIYGRILDIKELCRYYPDPAEVHPVHYRPLDRLKGYLEEASEQSDSEEKPKPSGGLSLWNVAYMNDFNEGESFGALMGHVASHREPAVDIASYVPKLHPQSTDEDLLPFGEKDIYTTSFSLSKDTIPMWVVYADNAKGCAVTYSEDFLNLRAAQDSLTDVAPYSDADYPLYRVQYIDTASIRKSELSAMTVPDIQEILSDICGLLDQLSKCPPAPSEQNHAAQAARKVIESFVGNCLNEVRFLIKDKEYESEKEVRMIHYSREHSLETEHSPIPRLFIKMDREVRFEEVMLGPKIDDFDANEIAVWLHQTGKVKHIVRSQRHYR